MGALADQLKQDHDDMRTMVAVLAEMASRFDEGDTVPVDDLRQVMGYMDVFVNRCHHTKEEEVLFPALEDAGLQREGGGPLEIMQAEHQLETNFLEGMNDAFGRYANGDAQAGQVISQYARDYAALLSRDMEQEDQLLLPIAEQQLPEAKQEDMAQQLESIEREVLGPKRHEPYHAMAHRLAELYLN
jgi:hemerythrin-like domain-containing protein